MGNSYATMTTQTSGCIAIIGLAYVVAVPYTNVATVEMTSNLRDQPGRDTVPSVAPVLDVYEIKVPLIEGFVPEWTKELNVAREPTKEDRARRYIPGFLNEVYSLSQIGDTDTAGFKVYDFLDRVLIDGFFAVCNEILSVVDINKLDTKLMDSFLTITAPAKTKLPSRVVLYKKIESKMTALRGPEKTRRILGSLA